MTRNAAIREILSESPSTCYDIAGALGITVRSATVGMWVLQSQRHVRKIEKTVPGAHYKPRYFYELTTHGRAEARFDINAAQRRMVA